MRSLPAPLFHRMNAVIQSLRNIADYPDSDASATVLDEIGAEWAALYEGLLPEALAQRAAISRTTGEACS